MLKKKPTAFIVSCALMALGSATSVYADCCPDPECPPKPCCEPVVCPPMPDDCCMRNICTPTGLITPQVDFIKDSVTEVTFTADFTYWTAREENLEFASAGSAQSTDAHAGTQRGQVYRPGNKWLPSFKVGLGADWCHDGWDVYAEYTWFQTTNHKKTGQVTGILTPALPADSTLLDSYWFINSGLNPLTNNTLNYISGSAKWHLQMNVLDLELGRNFYMSSRLALRPFYGLKATWQEQEMDVTFNTVGATLIPTGAVSMDNDIRNWGIGIRAGMDTSWHFTRSFSIIGNLALTALWEQFKLARFDTSVGSLTSIPSSNVNFKESSHEVKPVIEWMLGVKWETGISCDKYHFSLAAAWEEQVWFEHNQFLRLPGNAVGSGGDLSLQGLTVEASLNF